MTEEWKQLNNHPNYFVSSFGRIKNIKTNKIYTGQKNNCGYIRFDLCENGKRFVIHGHRAVAEAFIPKKEGKNIINHIDGNKTNNIITNLEWCTNKENSEHSIKVLHKITGGLNKKPVVCLETGFIYSSCVLAELMLGLCKGHVNTICNGKRKSTHGMHFEFY